MSYNEKFNWDLNLRKMEICWETLLKDFLGRRTRKKLINLLSCHVDTRLSAAALCHLFIKKKNQADTGRWLNLFCLSKNLKINNFQWWFQGNSFFSASVCFYCITVSRISVWLYNRAGIWNNVKEVYVKKFWNILLRSSQEMVQCSEKDE